MLEYAPYDELIKARDSIIREMRRYEKGKYDAIDMMMCPLPAVVYQCNLGYLSAICDLMQRHYRDGLMPPRAMPDFFEELDIIQKDN